jgi:SNF2 family DNA or RNA helicase
VIKIIIKFGEVTEFIFENYTEYKKIKETEEWNKVKETLDLQYNFNTKNWFCVMVDKKDFDFLKEIYFFIEGEKIYEDDFFLIDEQGDFVFEDELKKEIDKIRKSYSNGIRQYFGIPFKSLDEDYSKQIETNSSYLRDFQKKSLNKILNMLNTHKTSFLFFDMGLGKTVTSISTIVNSKEILNYESFVFVTLNSLVGQTADEIKKFHPELDPVTADKGALHVRLPDTSDNKKKKWRKVNLDEFWTSSKDNILITNYELMISMFNGNKFFTKGIDLGKTLFIFDEASRLKKHDKTTYKTLIKLIKKMENKGFEVGTTLMTGTPYENVLYDIFNIINFGFKDKITKKKFEEYFVLRDYRKFRGRGAYPVVGYRNFNLFYETFKDLYIRKRKKDVIKELPEKTEVIKMVSVDNVQKKAIDYLNKVLQGYVQNNSFLKKLEPYEIKMMITSIIRIIASDPNALINSDSKILDFHKELGMKHISSIIPKNYISKKTEKTLEILSEINLEEERIVIISQSTTVLDILKQHIEKHFKVPIFRIDGRVKDKNQARLDYINSKSGILLASSSISYGANFSDVNYMIEYDIPWNPSQRNQRIDRIYRMNSTESKFVVDLISEYEKRVYDTIIRKEGKFNVVVEGKSSDADFDANRILLEDMNIDLKALRRV